MSEAKEHNLEMENVNQNGLQKLNQDDLENVGGGFSKVSDPIYSLTDDEQKVLERSGYTLKKTGSGNFRVFYSNGCTIEPHVLQNMCNVINVAKKEFSW